MLKIWGRITSINVQKVVWTAGELGLPFERIDVGGSYGGVDTAEYARMNPNRLVPTIDDDGFILWESNAIVRYLASRHGAGRIWPGDLRTRADADRWMDWQATSFGPLMRDAFVGLIRTPPEQRNAERIDTAAAHSNRLGLILEDWLAGRQWLTGEDFTVADIAVGAQVHRWFGLPLDRPDTPRVQAWYDKLRARPAAQAALVELA